MLNVPALQACASSLPQNLRPTVDPGLSPILQALTLGLNAPSPHNTQSWRFAIRDDHEAFLHVDPTRLLRETDPFARQIHIGCGCFIEACSVGATTLGWSTQIELLPQGNYRSERDIGALPVARIRLTSRGEPAHPLAPYIFERRTSRLVYSGQPITADELAAIERDAGVSASRVTAILGERMEPYLRLFDRAMTIEFNTVATNEETRRWFRFSEEEAETLRDGLTFETNGITGLSATLARWSVDDTRKSWNSAGVIERGLENFREALYSARGVVLVSTEQNQVVDQLRVGRDCYRLMLSLTKHGYYCHPLSQVVQEYAAMERARRSFESLSGVGPPAKVQLIFRVGRSETPIESYRRELGSFV